MALSNIFREPRREIKQTMTISLRLEHLETIAECIDRANLDISALGMVRFLMELDTMGLCIAAKEDSEVESVTEPERPKLATFGDPIQF